MVRTVEPARGRQPRSRALARTKHEIDGVKASHLRTTVAVGSLFASGWAGLVYEVCWIRRASLVFGSTTLAISTVVAVFFLGLALGSYVFGRFARNMERPLRIFALLEVTVGALALLSIPAFDLADGAYSVVYQGLLQEPAQLFLSRVAIAAFVILPPTFLMGGTLPLFCRQFVTSNSGIALSVGVLYGMNTLGAALGCAAAGLWLLPELGLRGTVAVGAAMNLLAAVAALSLKMTAAPDEAPTRTEASPAPRLQTIVPFVFFFTGFVALGTEVLWSRFLALLVYNTVYTYTITLSVVLLGIVLGALLVGVRCDRWRSYGFVFGLLQMLTGLSVLFVMMLPPAVWERLGQGTWTFILLLLPPSILSGATLPLAVRMLVNRPFLTSGTVGRLVAVNTMGGILGSFAIGLLGLPMLGMQSTLLVTTGISLALGLAVWMLIEDRTSPLLRGSLIGIGLLCWILVPSVAGTRLPQDFLAGGDVRLVDYKEGLMSNVAVVLQKGVLKLDIDRLWQGENRKNHQALAAHIPMLLHPDPRRILVVGAGAGQTPSRFLMYGVDHVGCVDIEPAIFDVIRRHFDTGWMSDPRVELIRDDGRSFLAHSRAKYDVISLELGQIHRPGVAHFYTRDFYAQARARLNAGGYLSQFVPLPFFTAEQFRGVVQTFVSVFPQSMLWYNTSELLLIGTDEEELQVDASKMEAFLKDGPIAQDLSYSHWGGADFWLRNQKVFLASFLMGPSGLRELARGGAVYRDDRPVLDYAVYDRKADQAREIPLVDLLRRHVDPVATVFRAGILREDAMSIDRIREMNLGDIAATAYLRLANRLVPSSDYPQMIPILMEAVRSNAENYDARALFGEVLALQGRLEEAVVHYREAVRIRPNEVQTQTGLATALLYLHRPDEAIPRFQAALALQPDDAESYNNLGVAFGLQGKLEEGIRSFEQAIRLRPDYQDALVNLARAREAISSSK